MGAIKDHVNGLLRGGGGATKSAPRKATATPRKAVAPKTPKTPRTPNSAAPKPPKSSVKRKRTSMSGDEMSDVEESDDELSRADLIKDVARRASIPRSRKSPSKTYKEDSSDEEDEDEEEPVVKENAATNEFVAERTAERMTNGGDVIEDFFNIEGAAAEEGTNHLAGVRPSKKRRVEDNSDAMTDISSYSASFY